MPLVLARVPVVAVREEDGGLLREPVLPAIFRATPLGWGQAAAEGVGTPEGEMLVHALGSDADLDFLAVQPGATILGVALSGQEAADIVAALRSQAAAFGGWKAKADESRVRLLYLREQGLDPARDATALRLRREAAEISHAVRDAHRSPLSEWRSALRPLVATEVERRNRERGSVRVIALVKAVGVAAAAALLARHLGLDPAWVAAALGAWIASGAPAFEVLHADAFLGTTGDPLHDRTMDDSLGHWTVASWSSFAPQIQSNQAQFRTADIYDDAMDAVARQRVTAHLSSSTNNTGIAARRSGDHQLYWWRAPGGAAMQLRSVSTAGTGTLLASGSTTPGSTDVAALDCEDDDLTGYLEGAVEATAADGTYATGRAGFYGRAGAARTWDNWQVEVEVPDEVFLDAPGSGQVHAVVGVGVAEVAGPGGGVAADVGAFTPIAVHGPGGGTAEDAVLVAVAVPGVPSGAEPGNPAVIGVFAPTSAGPGGAASEVQVLAALFADAVPGGAASPLVAVAVALPGIPGSGTAPDAAFVAITAAGVATGTGDAIPLTLVALTGPVTPPSGGVAEATFVAVAHVAGTTGGGALNADALALVALETFSGGGPATVTVLAAVFALSAGPGTLFEPYVLVPAAGLPGNRIRARLSGPPGVRFHQPRARVRVLGEA